MSRSSPIRLSDMTPPAGIQKPEPLVLRTALECAETLPTSDWLLRPYLERNATGILYGDFGTFKSFLALDWALRVAIGIPAIGANYLREGAPVVFISAEGRGLGKRLRAWCRHTYSTRDWQDVLAKKPLHILEQAVNLSDPENARHLADAVDALKITPALVVIDTLSRNSSGEVEASTAEATAYLATVDQYLRSRFRCSVLMVHHVGHAEKGRIRGPIVLAANTDCLIRVERTVPGEPIINVTVERLKDSDLPAPVSLRAVVVDLGEQDEDGKAITSLALDDNGEAVEVKRPPVGKHQQALVAGLKEWQRSHPDLHYITGIDLTAICKSQGIDRRRKADVVAALEGAGLLTPAAGGHRVDL